MLRKFCQCAGLAALILLPRYAGMLGGGSDARLHSPYPLTSACLVQCIEILLLATLLFLLLAPLQRRLIYPRVRLWLLIGIPPCILLRTRTLFPFVWPHPMLAAFALIWALAIVLLYRRRPIWYGHIVQLSGALGLAFALFALVSMGQVLWLIRWKPMPQQYSATWSTAPQPPRHHPLLVWLILDELSYDQTFAHRQPGLNLPHFDALRSQSMLFTDVQPAGFFTTDVIPSLLSGKIIDQVALDMHNRLKVHPAGTSGWQPLSGRDTVFADAQQQGWRTAAVGWFNPYCAVYRDAIDDCFWNNQDGMTGATFTGNNVRQNLELSLSQTIHAIMPGGQGAAFVCDVQVRQHYRSHVELEPHMLQVLHADQADFVFLHLGVPHAPSIWNRNTGQYRQQCGGSYVDGLALADREVGLILNELQHSPRWNETTLIVEGDHSWRIPLWHGSPSWTHEDDVASKDVFDTRPALLIHQAGQIQPQTNTAAWPLIRVHAMVEEVLHGQSMTP